MMVLAGLGGGCQEESLFVAGGDHSRRCDIVNGTVDAAHPAVGVLHSGGFSACTATLVGPRTLLTAAHCVLSQAAPVQFLQPVSFYPEGLYGRAYPAAAVAVHPGYAGGNRSDLAVVRLSQDVPRVIPVAITTHAPTVGEPVVLVGYGKTGDPRDDFGTKRRAENVVGYVAAEFFSMYGASGSTGNSCSGDSGGPTFASRGGPETLIGVHSTGGTVCGQTGNDMRADVFYPWILQAAQGDLVAATAPVDTASPQIQVLAPLAGAEVGPSFTVKLDVSDDVGVTRVQLLVNGARVGELAAPPFEIRVDGVAEGPTTLEAVGTDGAGHTGSASVSVTVKVGLPPSAGARPFGAACSSGGECEGKICAPAASGGYCSRACAGPGECPADADCVDHVCRRREAQPAAGSFGAACTKPEECASGICVTEATTSKGVCTQLCNPGQSTCPSGSTCIPVGDAALCVPPL